MSRCPLADNCRDRYATVACDYPACYRPRRALQDAPGTTEGARPDPKAIPNAQSDSEAILERIGSLSRHVENLVERNDRLERRVEQAMSELLIVKADRDNLKTAVSILLGWKRRMDGEHK